MMCRIKYLKSGDSCPISGRNLALPGGRRDPAGVPGAGQGHEELVTHLTRTSPLSPGEATRVVAEVLGYFSESAEDFVRRRHRELRAEGLTNDAVFVRIAAELSARRVAAPRFSLRQLRRVVYG
jgi:hypothetical protein